MYVERQSILSLKKVEDGRSCQAQMTRDLGLAQHSQPRTALRGTPFILTLPLLHATSFSSPSSLPPAQHNCGAHSQSSYITRRALEKEAASNERPQRGRGFPTHHFNHPAATEPNRLFGRLHCNRPSLLVFAFPPFTADVNDSQPAHLRTAMSTPPRPRDRNRCLPARRRSSSNSLCRQP